MSTQKPRRQKLTEAERAALNQERTKKATANNIRRGEERKAEALIAAGWTVISPYDGSVRGPHKVTVEDADS